MYLADTLVLATARHGSSARAPSAICKLKLKAFLYCLTLFFCQPACLPSSLLACHCLKAPLEKELELVMDLDLDLELVLVLVLGLHYWSWYWSCSWTWLCGFVAMWLCGRSLLCLWLYNLFGLLRPPIGSLKCETWLHTNAQWQKTRYYQLILLQKKIIFKITLLVPWL